MRGNCDNIGAFTTMHAPKVPGNNVKPILIFFLKTLYAKLVKDVDDENNKVRKARELLLSGDIDK